MAAKLYGIPGSHPCIAAELMLDRKGVDYTRTDIPPAVTRLVLPAMRFPAGTVPSLRIDGRKITGSRELARALDQIQPEPPLLPADPAERARVEDAERWGDEVLQQASRRIMLWTVLRRPRSISGLLEGAKLPFPLPSSIAPASWPMLWLDARLHRVSEDTVRRALAELPSLLDTVDGWIADGTIGGDSPNAADCQIAPSLAMLMALADVRPAIESRPAGELARRLVPSYPGGVEAGVIPREWLAQLEPAAA